MQACSPTTAGKPHEPAPLPSNQSRSDPYAIVNGGLNHLETRPGDLTAALMVARAFVALGLIGPARDLLNQATDRGEPPPEFAAMQARIGRLPSGRVAWSSLQKRFETNLARIYRRFPELTEFDATFRNIPRRCELYQTRDGNFQVAARDRPGRVRWLPDLSDTNGVVTRARLPHDPQALLCGPYLITGDRLGALFNRVFDATHEMFLTYSPRLYVLEPDPAAFGVTLYVSESVDKLCHDRVILFVGPAAVERLTGHLEDHPARHAPEYSVGLTPASADLGNQAFEGLKPRAAAVAQRTRAARENVQRIYGTRPVAHWVNRFSPDRTGPLRVLGLTGRFTTYLQYSMRDWGAAFEARGHEFRMILEDSDHDLLPPFRMAEVIEQFRPDLIICIDHFRHEYGDNIPADVPFVGWIQDALPHLYARSCGGSLKALDYYIERDAHLMARKYGYPAGRGMTWPMVTNERLFSHQPMAENDLAPYRGDFSFVSNQSKVPEKFHEERRATFGKDPNALRLVDRLFEMLVAVHRDHPGAACLALRRIYADACIQTGTVPTTPEVEDLVYTAYLYPMSDLIFRQQALAWVTEYCTRTGRTLHLYGNGWEDHPQFQRYARGFARNGQELRAIYQASTINLQITSYGAVHQRMLDGLAAGGFFLIRESPGDTSHELARRFLAAARRYGARPDTPYNFGEMPDLDEAMDALWNRYSLPRPRGPYTIPADFYGKFEALEAGDFNQVAGAVFAPYRDVSFNSASGFAQLADRYLAGADERRATAAAMRQVVVERFTYGGLVDTMTSFIAADLAHAAGDKHDPRRNSRPSDVT